MGAIPTDRIVYEVSLRFSGQSEKAYSSDPCHLYTREQLDDEVKDRTLTHMRITGDIPPMLAKIGQDLISLELSNTSQNHLDALEQ